MKNEPAVVRATILAVVLATLGLLTQFGVPLTEGQQAAISTFAGVVGSLLVGFLIRAKVTPVTKLEVDALPRRAHPDDYAELRVQQLDADARSGVVSNTSE